MNRELTPGSIWQHYKGKDYVILNVAFDAHAEDQDVLEKKVVVYQALYRNDIYGEKAVWVRKKDDFLERLPTGEYRFIKIKA